MFNFLKEGLKKVARVFSEKVGKELERTETQSVSGAPESTAPRAQKEEPVVREEKREEKQEGKAQHREAVEKKFTETKPVEEKKETERKGEPKEERRGGLAALAEKVTREVLSERRFEELFAELEVDLLTNNIAVEVAEQIKQDLMKELVGKPLSRLRVSEVVSSALRNTIRKALDIEKPDVLKMVAAKRASGSPFIILFAGINGSGKTTTIAKLAHFFKEKGVSSVVAAADTFRAASIQQLEKHAEALNIRMIAHDYGSDPAAVAFDAIQYAKAKKVDVVLIDTAGRMHSNINLMDEMKKITRVAKPDLKIFVGESITGNDCVEQARRFNEAISIDAVILAKADVDDKGGAAVSISYVTGKPVLFLGTGQGYGDLAEFDAHQLVLEIKV